MNYGIMSVSSCIFASVAKCLLKAYIDGLVQDCSNCIANALELLQSCTKSSIYASVKWFIIGFENGLSDAKSLALPM